MDCCDVQEDGAMMGPDDEAVIAVTAAIDQMQTLYRELWIPFMASLNTMMREAGLNQEAVDSILVDVHQRWFMMESD